MNLISRLILLLIVIFSVSSKGADSSDDQKEYFLFLTPTNLAVSDFGKSDFIDAYKYVGESLLILDDNDHIDKWVKPTKTFSSDFKYRIIGKSPEYIINVLSGIDDNLRNKLKFTLQDARISEEYENTIEADLITTKRDVSFKICSTIFEDQWLKSIHSMILNEYLDIAGDNFFISGLNEKPVINEFLEKITRNKISQWDKIFKGVEFESMIAGKLEIIEKNGAPFEVLSWYFDDDDTFNIRIDPKNEIKIDMTVSLHPLVSDKINKNLISKYVFFSQGYDTDLGFNDYFLPFENAKYILKVSTSENKIIEIPVKISASLKNNEDENFYTSIKKHLTEKMPVELEFEYEQPRGYFLNNATPDSLLFINNYENVSSKISTELTIKEMEILNAYYIDISTGSFKFNEFMDILENDNINKDTFLFLTNGQHYVYGDYKRTKDIRSFDKVQTPNTFLDKINQFMNFAIKYDYNRGINPKRYKHNVNFLLSKSTVDYNLSRKGYTTDVFAERIRDVKKNMDAKSMALYYPADYKRNIEKFEGLDIITKEVNK